MTMVPSQNGKHQQNRSTNYAFYTASAMNQVEVEGYNNYNNCLLGSDFVVRHMAEDESRANTNSTTHNDAEAEAEAGSTSKEEERTNNNNNSSNWLQLSIGYHHQGDHDSGATTTTKQDHDHHHHHHHQPGSIMAPTGSGSLVELELLPGGRHLNWGSSSRPSLEPQAMFPLASSEVRGSARGSSFGGSLLFEQQTSMSMSMACGPISAPTFGHHQQQQQHHPQEMVNWVFGPLPHSMAVMPSPSFVSSSSSSSQSCSSLRPPPPPPIGSYFPTPFHFPSSGFDQFDVAGPSSDVAVRVVDPPRRPHSGIWFMLQASQNQ